MTEAAFERHVEDRISVLGREVELNRDRYHKLAGEMSSINLNIAGQLGEVRVTLARIEQNSIGSLARLDRVEAKLGHLEEEKASRADHDTLDQRVQKIEEQSAELRGSMRGLKISWGVISALVTLGLAVLTVVTFFTGR